MPLSTAITMSIIIYENPFRLELYGFYQSTKFVQMGKAIFRFDVPQMRMDLAVHKTFEIRIEDYMLSRWPSKAILLSRNVSHGNGTQGL